MFHRFLACHCSRICGCSVWLRCRSSFTCAQASFGCFFPIPTLHHQNTDLIFISFLYLNCRSVLLDPAAPWPTDGILYWLRLVIADHIPACPDVLLAYPLSTVSASLFILVVLAFVVSLLGQSIVKNQTMDDIEMTISCNPLCNGAADTCLPYDDHPAPPIDVDKEGKNQDRMESCRNYEEQAAGFLPFPGTLLGDGTFAIEYHNM